LKKILIYLSFIVILNADNVFFMPKDGYEAQKTLTYLFSHAKKNIKIAMYTFTNNKLAKALKIAAKKGVKIYIIADAKEAKYKYSVIPRLATIRHFNIHLLSGKRYKDNNKAKMHVKLAIIDNKYLVTGSANYSYSAFFKNYEYIDITQNKELINKFNKFFNYLKRASKPYRLSR